jgi:kumamolisin
MANPDQNKIRPADLKIFSSFRPAIESIVNAGALTPPQIAQAYNVPVSGGAGVKIGIASFGGGFYQSDLELAFSDLRNAGLLSQNAVAPTIKKVALDSQNGLYSSDPLASTENILDIYCISSLVPEADITIYIGDTYSSIVNRAIADGCHFLNFSWVTYELFATEQTEALFERANESGMTVVAAAGDNGSTVHYTDPFLTVGYPAGSPNVITVGGTNLVLNNDNTRLLENYNEDTSGGGGISIVFPLPDWQKGLYYTPIDSENQVGSRTPLTSRGVPDVSAPYQPYGIYDDGSIGFVGGTSASCPVILGLLARIQSLTGKKRSSIEYNRLFYSHPTAFYDVTEGQDNYTPGLGGYVGTAGWDPLTGLGPPADIRFYNFLKAANTRPKSGDVFPNYDYDIRPSSGQLWPRPQIVRG